MLLRERLVSAEEMLVGEMSMPREWVKSGERVMVKRPEPEKVSRRVVRGFGDEEEEVGDGEGGGGGGGGSRMCWRIQSVKMGRMELLFWKKAPAGLVNL